MNSVIRTNCPRDCYDGCGIVVNVKDGGKLQVSGDPDHPISRGSLCAKCGVAYNGVFQDESARLLTPLRRIGPKGAGEFEPISWGEALSTVAARYQPRASRQAGAAAAAAEGDKQERHPPAGGRSVTAFSVETWGRLGLLIW